MLRQILIGAAAGAAGTAALNVATSMDMALRGRAPSEVPSKVVEQLTEKAGIPLAAQDGDGAAETADHRRSGLGALLGYVAGFGVGAGYGLLRAIVDDLPMPVAATGLGLAAMATGDGPAIALGATNPKSWGFTGWLADVVPHAIYGLVTASAFDAFAGVRPGPRHASHLARKSNALLQFAGRLAHAA